jgi:tetratricopeptide (TPR) repeat protein
VEAAREAAALAPGSAAPLLLQARAERLLSQEATAAGDGTTAQLRLLDARKTAARLVEVAPADPEARREAGRVYRDSFQFSEAAACFRTALDASPARDGETVYDLAYCVGYSGDFKAALPIFEEAERLLGLQSRVAVNAAICEERLGDRKAAAARLARLYDAEVAAGRPESADAKRALEKTWELTVQRMDFDAGVAAFKALAEAHPTRPEPWFMQGNLLSFLGRHADAAAAYGRAVEVGPPPSAVARVRKARELAAAGPGKLKEAEAAVREALRSAAGQEELPAVVLRVARTLLDAGMPRGARELAAAGGEALAGNADLAILEGDSLMAEGKPVPAKEAYLHARDLAEYPDEGEARAARADLAALRIAVKNPAGGPDSHFPQAPGEALPPKPPDETLLDFDEAHLLVRPLGGLKLVDGAARFPPPAAGGSRRVALHFSPDLDASHWTHLDVRVRAEGGDALLRAEMADGMDQMSDLPQGRLRWPAGGPGEAVGGAWRTVSVPLRGFDMDPGVRTVPADLPRVKCVVLDFTAKEKGALPSLWIDSVSLRDAEGGRTRLLQGFDGGLEETGVVYEGTTPPFTRQITTPEMELDLLPTGTTPVSKAILEDQNGTFDPSMVGRGAGSLRVRHGESGYFPSKGQAQGGSMPDGPAWVRVVLGPPRDLLRFHSLTFMARGEKGGEKLRLRLEDARSAEMEQRIPQERWPRSCFPRTAAKDGYLTLTKEWRMYRVPLDAYPEVDRSALAEIDFELGSEVGNAPGAMIYVDEIGLEH